MATVSYRLEDLKKAIVGIGYVGENDHMHVLIDCKEVFDEYPDAVPTMAIVPPVGEGYPKAVTRNGDVVEWLVKDSDVTVEGDGEFQLTFTEGEIIRKSVNARFRVKRSISGSGSAPSGVQDWLTDANEKLAEVEQATQDAEAAANHQPYIGIDGYWYTWNGEEFVKNVKAQGDKGDPGDPGSPGDPTQLIDDTAGEGQTGKTWSADKLDETTSQLLTAISGKADKEDTVLTSTLSRGRTNTAGLGSVAFGNNVTAKGNYSQAFGEDTEANEDHSYAEGGTTQSNARYAHAEGAYANADGGASHTQGFHTTAEFPCSDAGGMYNYLYSVTTWAKNTTYAVGRIVRRTVNPESKVYKCNTAHTSGTSFDSSKWDDITNQALLESIGNGTGIYANRSTARSLDRAGNERLKGDLYVGCNADSTGGTKVAKETVIAPAFYETTANAAGTYVMYTDGVVYYLPDGHTADATWENTNKTATNIGAEITSVKTAIQGKYTKPSGGIPATDIADGVIPVVDSALSDSSENAVQNKVVKGALDTKAPAIINTATGNPAVFNDGGGMPIKSLLIPFTPKQSGTGDPSPQNIRPFLPWNGLTVWKMGKNLLNPVWWDNVSDNKSYIRYEDGTLVYQAITYKTSDYVSVMGNTEYTLHAVMSGQSAGGIAFYDSSKQYISGIQINNSTKTDHTFTTPSNAVYMRFWDNGGKMPWNEVMLVYGSTVPTAYEPYYPITETTIPFPSPVYGGEHEAVSGRLFSEWAEIASYNGETLPGEWLSDRDVYSAGTTPTIGAQVVYKLATPTEQTLTGQHINSLVGGNTIWSDADGKMIVEYPADTALFIANQHRNFIAPELSSMIADTALVKNDFRIVGNNLYKITTAIASGGMLTPNTNCVKTTLAEVIKPLLT